jgi:hypothetical protein
MTLLQQFCDQSGLEQLNKVDQAILLGWFLCKSGGRTEFSIDEVSALFADVPLPRPKAARLREDFARHPDVHRGSRQGMYQITRSKGKDFEEWFGELFKEPEAPKQKAPTPITVLERADIAKAPRLGPDDIAAAQKMAELYIIMHCYENSARRVVEEALSKKLGPNWWDQAASNSMKQKVQDRQAKEARSKWITPRGTSPLFYVDWGDLLFLIRRNEADFAALIPEYKFVETRFEELERFRNIAAHSGTLPSSDDFDFVVLSFRHWCKQLA